MIGRGELEKLAKDPAFHSEVQDMFFEAMTAGHASLTSPSSPAKGTIVELRGSKTFTHARIPWKVVDVYLVTPLSTRSGGMTVISYEGVPVWMMQYFGEYEKQAISCLKAALREAYSRDEFIGGRGPLKLVYGKYEYQNHPVLSTFERFSGFESVTRGVGAILGTHQYHGGLML